MSSVEMVTQSFLRFFEQNFSAGYTEERSTILARREKRLAQYILVLQIYPHYTGNKAYLWAYLGA